MKPNKAAVYSLTIIALFLISTAFLSAQDDFGFGFGDQDDPSGETAGSFVTPAETGAVVGGKLEYDTTGFFDQGTESTLSGSATGRLEFTATGSSVDALLRMKINERILSEYPEDLVEEASVKMYKGKFEIEGGLLKVVWGKADSQGPLDILNPLDLSDLTVTDTMERKIAQPMLRASYAIGNFSKLEAVIIPGFKAHCIAWEGRWRSSQVRSLKTEGYNLLYYGTDPTANGGYGNGLYYSCMMDVWSKAFSQAFASSGDRTVATNAADGAVAAQQGMIAYRAESAANEQLEDILDYPDSRTLEYVQGGLRFTTTAGGVDLGLQYFTGFLPTPVIAMDPAEIMENNYHAAVLYNRYHQVGADLATVLGAYNIRTEIAFNMTDDPAGDDPAVYNPNLAWSLGFDRDLFSNINLNLQYNGTYRLFDEGIDETGYDIEADADLTKTKITAKLSQKLFKDTVEWELKGLFGIEDRDFLIMPVLGLAVGEAEIEFAGGFFGGNEEGEMGQFSDNDYLRLSLSYAY